MSEVTLMSVACMSACISKLGGLAGGSEVGCSEISREDRSREGGGEQHHIYVYTLSAVM